MDAEGHEYQRMAGRIGSGVGETQVDFE